MDDAQPQARLLADGTTRHEANRLRVRGLAWFAAALIGITALVLLLLTLVMQTFLREQLHLESLAPPRFRGDTGEYPSPRIQADPADELKKMKTEDLERLNTYGWVDRKAGVAHIPVDRAIKILAQKGLPTAAERGATPGKPAEKENASDRKEPAKAAAPGEPKR